MRTKLSPTLATQPLEELGRVVLSPQRLVHCLSFEKYFFNRLPVTSCVMRHASCFLSTALVFKSTDALEHQVLVCILGLVRRSKPFKKQSFRQAFHFIENTAPSPSLAT